MLWHLEDKLPVVGSDAHFRTKTRLVYPGVSKRGSWFDKY